MKDFPFGKISRKWTQLFRMLAGKGREQSRAGQRLLAIR